MSCTPSISHVYSKYPLCTPLCCIYISYICTAAHDIPKLDALLPGIEPVTALYN